MLRGLNTDVVVGYHSSIGTYLDGSNRLNTDSWAMVGLQTTSTPITIAVVADAWRGTDDEEEKGASQLAIDTILETFEENDTDYIPALLNQSFVAISHRLAINSTAAVSCALVALAENRIYMANCGDCRVFMQRDHFIRQISVTHTFEEKLLDEGRITLDELKDNSLFRYPMMRALGFNETDNCPDLRIYLSDTDTHDTAEQNQGSLLLPLDRIILTTGSVFQRWRSKEEWQWFLDSFRTHNHPQEAIDHFTSLMRDKYSYRWFTTIALQLP